MKRTLRLTREALAELGPGDLANVAGGDAQTLLLSCVAGTTDYVPVPPTIPPDQCVVVHPPTGPCPTLWC